MREMVIGLALVLLLNGMAEATEVIAQRGVHQQPDRRQAVMGTCEAQRMLPSDHDYLENTIAAMRAAFEAGADWVEMDLQVTADGRVVVFDDPTLDCRTDGSGAISGHTLASLRRLDLGYGYSTDGGYTYPFRCGANDTSCRDRHRIPTMWEVLTAFPGGRFILNLKSPKLDDADLVAARLAQWVEEGWLQIGRLMVFSDQDAEINTRVQAALPGLAVPKLESQRINLCLASFARSGLFPDDCAGGDIAVSVERMDALGPRAQFLSTAVHGMGGALHVYGVNSKAAYRFAAALSPDFIWTNRIEMLGL